MVIWRPVTLCLLPPKAFGPEKHLQRQFCVTLREAIVEEVDNLRRW